MKTVIIISYILFSSLIFAYNGNNVVIKLKIEEKLNEKINNEYILKNLLIPSIQAAENIEEIIFYNDDFIGNVSYIVKTNNHNYNGSFTVEQFRQVYFIKNDVKKGTVLTEDDLYSKKISISSKTTDLIENIEQINNLVLKTNLQKNSQLFLYQFEKPNIIKNGDVVNIIVQKGNLKLSTLGIAKQNGKESSMIIVQNTDTQKQLKVKVIDSKNVVLLMGE